MKSWRSFGVAALAAALLLPSGRAEGRGHMRGFSPRGGGLGMVFGAAMAQARARAAWEAREAAAEAARRAKNNAQRMTYADAMALMHDHRATHQSAIFAVGPTVLPTGAGRSPIPVFGFAVYDEFFPMVDVPFEYGSGWSADDDAQGAPVVVISDALNLRHDGVIIHLAASIPRKLDLPRLLQFEKRRVEIENLRRLKQRKQRNRSAISGSHGSIHQPCNGIPRCTALRAFSEALATSTSQLFLSALRPSSTTVAERWFMPGMHNKAKSSHARTRAGQS